MTELPTKPMAVAPDTTARELPVLREAGYRVFFASTPEDVRRAQRLRFEVFNLELEEGLEASFAQGLDQDAFDDACDHLLVCDDETDELIGTYRMQPASRPLDELYCSQEFDLRGLPPEVLERGAELGRACVAREHRNGQVLFALWRGLAAYATWKGVRYFFGCSSLTTQDEDLGWRVYDDLRAKGRLIPGVHVSPRQAFQCRRDPGDKGSVPELPRLFRTYLRYGARVCGPPAIDRAFKTIDYLILLDIERLEPRMRRMFFVGLEPGGASEERTA